MIGFSRVVSGLRASERALYVAGSNITNVNTRI
jgi:flagellar hook protein FlgE